MRHKYTKKFKKLKLIILTLCVFFTTNIVLANSNVTLTTKNPDPDTGNSSWFKFNIKPGETLSDSVLLTNLDNDEITLKLYGADAYSNDSGSFILNNENQTNKTVGDWIKLNENIVTLGPKEKREVHFTIKVPNNTSPGNFAGGILMTETEKPLNIPPKMECVEAKGCNTSIKIATRIANRIYIYVPGEVNSNIEWSDFSSKTNSKNELVFKFKFNNTGNVYYEPKAVFEIFDFLGKRTDRIEKGLGESMPGTVTEPQVSIKPTGDLGFYTVKTTVFFEPKYLQYNDLKSAPETAHRNLQIFLLPWQITLALTLILLTLLGFFGYRRFVFMKLSANTFLYTVGPNENIEEIAQKFQNKWKNLTKLNRLKEPYILKQGQTIKVTKINDSH